MEHKKRKRKSLNVPVKGVSDLKRKNCPEDHNEDFSEEIWNSQHKLGAEEIDILLNRSGLLGKYRDSCPEPPSIEILRWNELAGLREFFREICSANGLGRKDLPSGAWEKWHSVLMTASSPPMDPLVPNILGETSPVRAVATQTMVAALLKSGATEEAAREMSDALATRAADAAASLHARIEAARSGKAVAADAAEPRVVVLQAEDSILLRPPAPDHAGGSGPEVRLNSAHYRKLRQLWEVNANHRRQLAGLRKVKDGDRRGGGGGAADTAAADLAEFHRSGPILRARCSTTRNRRGF
jgi:hypothetical protein